MKPARKRHILIAVLVSVLGIAGIVLILISIFGKPDSSWPLIAGLACIVPGSLCNILLAVRSIRNPGRKLEK